VDFPPSPTHILKEESAALRDLFPRRQSYICIYIYIKHNLDVAFSKVPHYILMSVLQVLQYKGPRGYAAFATQNMSKGDIVIQYCGDLVTEDVANERDVRYKEQQLPPAIFNVGRNIRYEYM
jgi:hypothetical protein